MFVYTLSSKKKQSLLCKKVTKSHYDVDNDRVIGGCSSINHAEVLLQLFVKDTALL